ncbi:unnamed protein product [Cladocopium goreaui]|uniref:Uncharacterized protein n=1 Tax=Cladocopium goreaui TaxID=2562237 RepID=A0A9P1G4C9_9DINO|nr:unnamed protein product [Cladocopium goreaui]
MLCRPIGMCLPGCLALRLSALVFGMMFPPGQPSPSRRVAEASRDGVHENGHNEELSLQAAEAFAQLARGLGDQPAAEWSPLPLLTTSLGRRFPCSPLPYRLEASPVDYLGDRPPLSRFWRKVRERFIHALLRADVQCLAVEEAGPSATRFVSAKQALRRPQQGAPEQAAASLVSGATLLASVQRYFVREPLPQGLQLETFAASHFARCLPNLIKAALALEEYADRVKKLTQIYRAFEELLSDPRCGVATIEERAELAREAVCWPCMANGQGCVLCAGSFGSIFVASDSQAWEEFLPEPGEASCLPWRLRVLQPEACEAVVAAPGLLEMAQLRPRWRICLA